MLKIWNIKNTGVTLSIKKRNLSTIHKPKLQKLSYSSFFYYAHLLKAKVDAVD